MRWNEWTKSSYQLFVWRVCFEILVFIIKIIWPKKLVFLEDDIFHISLNVYQFIENILLCMLKSWDTNIWIPVFQIMNKCFEIPTQLLKFNRLFINNPSFIWFWILRLLLINLGIIIFWLNEWSDPKCIWFNVLKYADFDLFSDFLRSRPILRCL